METNIVTELTEDIKKLYALEDSIVNADHMGSSSELRSKQAVLISDIIQSLQRITNTITQD